MVSIGLSDLEKGIIQWQSETFPESTPRGVYHHLIREFAEVIDFVEQYGLRRAVLAEELADIFILSVALANHLGFNFTQEIERKMEINRARKWAEPDEEGVIEHRRDLDERD